MDYIAAAKRLDVGDFDTMNASDYRNEHRQQLVRFRANCLND